MEASHQGTAAPWTPHPGRRPRLATAFLALAAALVFQPACAPEAVETKLPQSDRAAEAAAWTPPLPAGAESVSLKIDFGNGVRREFAALPWRDGMTVGDLMRAAAQVRPALSYQTLGSGDMTMLTVLDGVANGAAAGRYWLYEVNGQRGDRSFEVMPVTPGGRVLWTFKPPE